jgi:hypothetical protein
MHESSEMNRDPLSDKLARFTPSSAGFDRDSLLFSAGRASASSNRLWPMLVGILTVSQVITLTILLRTPAPVTIPNAPISQPTVVSPDSSPANRPPPSEPSLWTLEKRWLDQGESLPAPIGSEKIVSSSQNLTVMSIPSSLLTDN